MVLSMNYFLTVSSIIIYIENRVEEKIDYAELEKATGFSIAHIRDIFCSKTGMTLSRYILNRKISNAAYEILYNTQRGNNTQSSNNTQTSNNTNYIKNSNSTLSIMDISVKYGFINYDTFTRAFKRITGLTPTEFKRKRPPVGRIKLCAGAFGIGLLSPANREVKNHE